MKNQYLLLGKISGFFGVKGWVKIYSYGRPRETINQYTSFFLSGSDNAKSIQFTSIKKSGKHVVGKIENVDTREAAELFLGKQLYVHQKDLPQLDGEYYWYQLIGLTIVNKNQQLIGTLGSMMETGANDVLVIKSQQGDEILIPYVWDSYVISVDLGQSKIVVDWDLDD